MGMRAAIVICEAWRPAVGGCIANRRPAKPAERPHPVEVAKSRARPVSTLITLDRDASNIPSTKLVDMGRHRATPVGRVGEQRPGRWHYPTPAGRPYADS